MGSAMSEQDKQPRKDSGEALRGSPVLEEFKAELEEILRHKWIESEKANRDVGFDWALTDWVLRHRAGWLKARRQRQKSNSR